MSGDTIAILVIAWVVIGGIAAFGIGDQGGSDRAAAMGFFWPITLPILLVFGVVWTVYASVRTGINFFKE